jgi:tRNA-splicing ligase RtcB (3'-phosphate/5'-hydroxy nucleic acid ligase)
MEVVYDQNTQRVPIKVWASDLDEGTLAQAQNLARLPFAARHVALMPDAHHGYGIYAAPGMLEPVRA